MWYAIVTEDAPNSLEKRMAARAAHLARLQAMQDEARLLLAGPFPSIDNEDPGEAGYSGSLIVAAFISLQDAIIWANADPFVTAGVYAKVTVKPFRKTLPAMPVLPDLEVY
ncbi:MAG: YciI family protein [Methylophilaceae bacterium]|nr:YciI family protein [Methylophilaceae bacterium]